MSVAAAATFLRGVALADVTIEEGVSVGIWDRLQMLLGRRTAKENGAKTFEFVYVNQDGTARELSSDERDYLSTDFLPNDGARPYIKRSYAALDGWGSMSGFLRRRKLPPSVAVKPVNPNYRTPTSGVLDFAEAGGGYESIRRKRLESQRANELAAEATAPPVLEN